ncbi:MAG: ParA family protein [Clostridia bacterium]|nr:ParA family protein [Clostridia bacterium]
MYIIAFANQKGGVGKTTSAVNTAAALGAMGKSVLLIDLDPQGSSTSGVGIHKNAVKHTSYDILTGNCNNVNEAIIKTKFKNLSIISSNISLAAAEFELTTEENREFFLKNALNNLKEANEYDYAIIDCPPSLGLITINALTASDGVVIPMQCEYFALEGLSQLMMTVKNVRQRYNPSLNITGILITMYNPRYKLSSQVLLELKKYYDDLLFGTKISRVISLSEAPSFGEPIYYYARYSKGSLEYEDIANEIISRIEG